LDNLVGGIVCAEFGFADELLQLLKCPFQSRLPHGAHGIGGVNDLAFAWVADRGKEGADARDVGRVNAPLFIIVRHCPKHPCDVTVLERGQISVAIVAGAIKEDRDLQRLLARVRSRQVLVGSDDGPGLRCSAELWPR
jgi:hypothetical protein